MNHAVVSLLATSLVVGCLDSGTSGRVDRDTLDPFDVGLMTPAEQGFVELAVTLDRMEGVGDAAWDLRVEDDMTPRTTIWEQRASSSQVGDGTGSFDYVGPCSSETETARDGLVTARLVGLYAVSLATAAGWDAVGTYGNFGDESPAGVLETWPLAPITRVFGCRKNQDVYVEVPAALALPVQTDGAVAARFGGVDCEAGWECDSAGAAALTLSCASAGQVPPTLYLDDLMLRCPGREDARIDPTASSEVEEHAGDGVATATWRVSPGLDAAALYSGACTLAARATAAAPSTEPLRAAPRDGAIAAGDIYPMLTWTVPVSDADGPTCAPAQLDLTGPVTVTYASTAAPEAVTFPYRSR